MAFKTRKSEEFSYSSPQEMYQDNKYKKIMGPLDYQALMLDLYIKNYNNKTVALELPTGSGKTLVGLLIGEYRRKKNKEKILFLCPTNQLVHQVVNEANNKYGLKAIAFCGKQRNYSPKDKSNFLMANVIAVTTYSSFFAQYSFFEDVDILIMDDVHSCEDYIISNWTIQIERNDSSFSPIVELIKPILNETDYQYLCSDDCSADVLTWCNLVPAPLLSTKISDLDSILRTSFKEGMANFYSYSRISENLKECNMFISNGAILIRPWIAPTLTFPPFSQAKQRILMSATLGSSGELERITGIEKITRLPIVNDWDKKGLGRKFFTFPDLSLGADYQGDVIIALHNLCKKSVFLVPDTKSSDIIHEFFTKYLPNSVVLNAKDIERAKTEFTDNPEATVILANRFDGIDFPDEESRLLFIWNLPKTTNMQERFLISRTGASKLYAERIKTRIIQAVGRCSRNPSDYSIVCVMGNTIQNDLTKHDKLRQFPPELRAELQFGLENSTDYATVDDIIIQSKDFLSRNQSWQEAEEYIVDLRNGYWTEEDEPTKLINQKLQESATFELKFQYALWKKDYHTAYDMAYNTTGLLNAPSLSGYKCFWKYLSGSMAYYLFSNGQSEFKPVAIKCFSDAIKDSTSIRWLSSLSSKLFLIEDHIDTIDDFFFDTIERIEDKFTAITTRQKMEKIISQIMTNLSSTDGKTFERGHKELGDLLGYITENPESAGAPDPYWIINAKTLIVSEDKIYEEKEEIKSIPISDVSETVRHKTWILENEHRIIKDSKIITILISNSSSIEDEARIYAGDIYYINRTTYLKWAEKAVAVIRSAWNTFVDVGDIGWRESVHQMFLSNEITPLDYIKFVTQQSLKKL